MSGVVWTLFTSMTRYARLMRQVQLLLKVYNFSPLYNDFSQCKSYREESVSHCKTVEKGTHICRIPSSVFWGQGARGYMPC